MHAHAWLRQVDHNQANHQSNGGHNLEIQQRIPAGLADGLHVLHAGNATDHSAEDDWRNHHLDQFDEAITQRFERHTGFRVKVAEQNADGDGSQHLDIKHSVEGLTGCFERRGGHGRVLHGVAAHHPSTLATP